MRLEYTEVKSAHNPGEFREALFVNHRGLRLRAYTACRAEEPRGAIVVHHGIRSHGLFEVLMPESPGGPRTCVRGSIAELLLEEGFALHTYDCEGHGLSESTCVRGFFTDAWNLASDLVQFAALVRRERPGLPLFACGSSMGGGICVGAAILDPKAFDGILLAAPMVSVERVASRGCNRCFAAVGPCALRCCPCAQTWRLVSFPRHDDENTRKTFAEDPLTESSSRLMLQTSFAALSYCKDVVRLLDSFATPFLTMHAREDVFTDFESSELLMARASTKDKTLLEPPAGSDHDLFGGQASREWVRMSMSGWLGERCQPA